MSRDASRRAAARRALRELPLASLVPGGILVLAGGALWWSTASFVVEPSLFGAAGPVVAVLIGSLALRTLGAIVSETARPHVVAYFERRVGCAWSLSDGYALYSRWAFLEREAAELGLRPPSTFGFADDRLGDRLTWHDAGVVAQCFAGLRSRVARDEPSDALLLADLDALIARLEAAAVSKIGCCLHVRRADDWITPLEFAQRTGHYD